MTDEPVCPDCGQRHQREHRFRGGAVHTIATCGGHVTTDRESYVPGQPRKKLDQPRPCGNPRPKDAGLEWKCHTHGGAAPQVKAAREQRVSEEKAAQILRRFGQPIDTTPTEALLDAVKWTAGYVGWLREKVASTEADRDSMDGVDADRVPLVNEERALTQMSRVTGKREPSVWLDLLGTWHDRLVRICGEAIKAGIEERRVRIAEQQGALVADVIRKILSALDLSPEQAIKAGEVVPLELRRLAG